MTGTWSGTLKYCPAKFSNGCYCSADGFHSSGETVYPFPKGMKIFGFVLFQGFFLRRTIKKILKNAEKENDRRT